jgi:hypothetical protein
LIHQGLADLEIVRVIDHSIYPRKAISEARSAYKEYCSVRVEPLPNNKAQLTISVSTDEGQSAREVSLSFLNFALDKASEQHLQEL